MSSPLSVEGRGEYFPPTLEKPSLRDDSRRDATTKSSCPVSPGVEETLGLETPAGKAWLRVEACVMETGFLQREIQVQ